MAPRISTPRLTALLLFAGTLLLTGCASSQHAADTPPHMPRTQNTALSQSQGQGGSWAAVMPTPEIEPVLDFTPNARRDLDLQPDGRDRLATATDQWPRPDRPTFERSRFLRTTGSSRSGFIMFNAESRHRLEHQRRDWYP